MAYMLLFTCKLNIKEMTLMKIVEEYTSVNKQNDVEFRYSYRLTNKEFHGMMVYGIEVERKDYVGAKNVNLERDKIDIISPEKDDVEKMLIKIWNNQLSPIHLIDVLGSYVDNNVYKFNI